MSIKARLVAVLAMILAVFTGAAIVTLINLNAQMPKLEVTEDSAAATARESQPSAPDRPSTRPGETSIWGRGYFRKTAFQSQHNAAREYQEGLRLAEHGEVDQAIENFRSAIRVNPKFTDAYLALGVLLQRQGRENAPAAMDAFLRVLELNPRQVGAHLHISAILAEGGDSEAASAQLRKAVDLDPLNAEIRVLLGRQLYRSQKYPEALECFDAALRLNPNLGGAHFGRALTFLKQRSLPEAQMAFQNVLRLNPADAEAHFHLGRIASEMDASSEALNHLKEAIRLHPAFAEAREELAKVYRRQGLDAAAEQELREALRDNPNHFDAVYSLATLLRTQGRMEEAKPLFDRIQTLQGERGAIGRATALNADGLKLMDDGKPEAALEAFRQARHVDPTFFMAAYNEGVVLARQGQKPAAVAVLRDAVRLRPDFVMAHYALGIVLKTLGDPEGDREIEKAHALNKFVAQPLGRDAAVFSRTSPADPPK